MSQAQYYQDQKQATEEEKAFLSKYRDPQTGVLKNVPVKGRFDGESEIVEKLMYAISNDPRRQSHEDVPDKDGNVRDRKALAYEYFSEGFQSRLNNQAPDYNKQVLASVESMGLNGYRERRSTHWAREDNEE